MKQTSYSTITITDTTDIDEIYMIYAGSNSDTVAPTFTYQAITNPNIWNRDVTQLDNYNYLWQSTVITKSGVVIDSTNWEDFYGTPVCVTGNDGKGISNIEIQYCNYASGTPSDTSTRWQDEPPTYNSEYPNYWTKTTITYTEGNPFVKKVLDQGLTDAMRTAYEASQLVNQLDTTVNGDAFYQSTKSLSGSMVSFSANERVNISSLITNITPIQSGSGDSSPTNVRNISGWDGITVHRTGKNLFDADTWTGGGQTAWVKNADNDYTFAKTSTSTTNRMSNRGTFSVPINNYYLSFNSETQHASSIVVRPYVNGAYKSGWTLSYANGQYYRAFTTAAGTTGLQIYYSNNSTGVGSSIDVSNVQIELGTSATEFAPYTGAAYNITFTDAGTVYAGTFNVITGLLTVTHKLTNLHFKSRGVTNISGKYRFLCSPILNVKSNAGSEFLFNRAKYAATTYTNPEDGTVSIYTDSSACTCYVYIDAISEMTLADAQTWLASNPIQVLYPLNEPEVYQLSTNSISTLSGDNNIWVDGLNSQVQYIISVSYDSATDEYYYMLNDDRIVIDYSELDKSTNGVPIVNYDGGLTNVVSSLQTKVNTINGSVDISSDTNPYVFIHTYNSNRSGDNLGEVSGVKITDTRVDFIQQTSDFEPTTDTSVDITKTYYIREGDRYIEVTNPSDSELSLYYELVTGAAETVMYMDSTEDKGTINITNAVVYSLRIGNLELVNHNNGIAIRRA